MSNQSGFTAAELRQLAISDDSQDQDHSTRSAPRASRRAYSRRPPTPSPIVCQPLWEGFNTMSDDERAWAIEQGWITPCKLAQLTLIADTLEGGS